jgi:heterodisulfide reductase subunit A
MEKLGLRTERLGLEWISAAEGLRFQQVMQCMEQIRKSVTPEEIADSMRIIKKQRSHSQK